ncbi:hypothetical protein Q3G72_000600 [Acer saccharum]|nr:hypothetical protein Q3G72_000600 [Acer saccharum]
MESKTKTTRLTKTNSGSSSRFLHCFKPPEMDINDRSCVPVRPVRGCRDGFGHHEPVFTYVDVAEKPGVVFTRILSDDVGSGGGGNNQDQNGVVEKKKRGGSRSGRKLLCMMRAVMFETSLAKKIRKKKHKHKQWQSDKNGNSIQQEYTEDENGRTISRNSSSSRYSSVMSSTITSSSSACSSSLSSNARQLSSFWSSGEESVPLFVLQLGSFSCLNDGDHQSSTAPHRKNVGDYANAKLHSENYKKKIIMEGLLERNHSPWSIAID